LGEVYPLPILSFSFVLGGFAAEDDRKEMILEGCKPSKPPAEKATA
jgi:hypothetical protein